MNYWLFRQEAKILEENILLFTDEYSGTWSGEPDDRDNARGYKEQDVVYLMTTDGNLRGWGFIVSATHRGVIDADDDEEGQVPPFFVNYSDSIAVQPRVIFNQALVVPAELAQIRHLEEVKARRINSLIREISEPKIVTADFVSPKLIRELVTDPRILQSLHWRDFEIMLAEILEKFGYVIDLRRGTKDGGVDLFALSKVGHPLGPHKYLLQAKRWKNSVGVAPVRELKFLHDHHGMTKSCLATTAAFTSGAWELARQYPHQLELRDMDGLKEWVNHAWDLDCCRDKHHKGSIYGNDSHEHKIAGQAAEHGA